MSKYGFLDKPLPFNVKENNRKERMKTVNGNRRHRMNLSCADMTDDQFVRDCIKNLGIRCSGPIEDVRWMALQILESRKDENNAP